MRVLWNFILLGILLNISIQLAVAAPTAESDDELDDTVEQLKEFEELRQKDREKLQKETASKANNDIPQPGEMFEGDIIMDESLRKAVLGQADKRSAFRDENKLWPNGIVYYTIDKKIRSRSKICILAAIRTLHKHTCVRFKRRTNEPDYIFITSRHNVCSSYVGKRGGSQPVTIGRGCTRLGTCQHELMHALGTIHEQSRPDRDQHVRIIWSNIKSNEVNNFHKYSYQTVSDEGVDYDFMSVMHYPNHAFAIDRSQPTIVSLKDPELGFGQRRMFSTGDVAAINKLYKCPKDRYSDDLPEVLSDERVEELKDSRKRIFSFV